MIVPSLNRRASLSHHCLIPMGLVGPSGLFADSTWLVKTEAAKQLRQAIQRIGFALFHGWVMLGQRLVTNLSQDRQSTSHVRSWQWNNTCRGEGGPTSTNRSFSFLCSCFWKWWIDNMMFRNVICSRYFVLVTSFSMNSFPAPQAWRAMAGLEEQLSRETDMSEEIGGFLCFDGDNVTICVTMCFENGVGRCRKLLNRVCMIGLKCFDFWSFWRLFACIFLSSGFLLEFCSLAG